MHKEMKLECAIFWARLASFGHLGIISDPLIVSQFHNDTCNPTYPVLVKITQYDTLNSMF